MRRMIIMGAAGRDFHVFNCCYRNNPEVEVVAFTATQIPHIENRRYPAALAGSSYPDGIKIHPETELEELIEKLGVDEVVFAYSDVSLDYLAERQAKVESSGARFSTYDVDATMLEAQKPVIAVTAVRTGAGKSQTARRVTELLKTRGKRVVAVRHPMPYGDLERQAVQRFAEYDDLASCTIEEREEYEPHLKNGVIVYAGVDYAAILERAEQEADVIVWDGGNNDAPFFKPDLWITLADPHRAGDELEYFPSRVNFERADLILINKTDSADAAAVALVEQNAKKLNPDAIIVHGRSPLDIPEPAAIRGKRVLAVEDGPTTTHGGMAYGAAVLAARQNGAASIVDPRPWAVGEIAETFVAYPNTGPLLPAMGYGETQVAELQASINAVDCDLVLIATPIDLTRLIRIDKPTQRIRYRLDEQGSALADAIFRAI